jgi:tetratricopeptide (TPR) repeat protein
MQFELKTLSKAAIPAALERAERYRLLNEPVQAESICLDILAADPDNQQAIVLLLLALSDQFAENISENLDRASTLLPRLGDEYLQAYYKGILFERQARVYMRRSTPGSGFSAYDLFCEAMRHYERAEELRPPENDEALLRWNTCARTILANGLEARPADDFRPMLE